MERNEQSLKEIGNIQKIELMNLGTVNKNQIVMQTNKGRLVLYFSYKTLVGFESPNNRGCLINYWSNTTGKLLNEIEPNKKARVKQEDFNNLLSKAFISIGLGQNIKVGQQ